MSESLLCADGGATPCWGLDFLLSKNMRRIHRILCGTMSYYTNGHAHYLIVYIY